MQTQVTLDYIIVSVFATSSPKANYCLSPGISGQAWLISLNVMFLSSDIKLPDEQQELSRGKSSPEVRMDKYIMEQKLALGESVAEASEHLPAQSNGKLALGESVVETSEFLPAEQHGVAVVIMDMDHGKGTDDDCDLNHVSNANHPVPTTDGQLFLHEDSMHVHVHVDAALNYLSGVG